MCEAPLEHTSAEKSGATLATLRVDGGYWRATTESETVLECYNADACVGGETGSDSYCAPEYTGPCEGVAAKASVLVLLWIVRVVSGDVVTVLTPPRRFLTHY